MKTASTKNCIGFIIVDSKDCGVADYYVAAVYTLYVFVLLGFMFFTSPQTFSFETGGPVLAHLNGPCSGGLYGP